MTLSQVQWKKLPSIAHVNCTFTWLVFTIKKMCFYVYNLFLLLHFCEKFVTWGLFSLSLCVYVFTTQVVHLREELNFLLMSFGFVKELITLPLIYVFL